MFISSLLISIILFVVTISSDHRKGLSLYQVHQALWQTSDNAKVGVFNWQAEITLTGTEISGF